MRLPCCNADGITYVFKISYLSLFQAHFLNKQQRYNRPFRNKALKLLGVLVVLLFFLVPPSFSQNTKGDRPAASGSKRESKFKGSSKQKSKPKKSYNRVQSKGVSQASSARSSRPAKLYSQKSQFVNNASRSSKDAKPNFRSSGRVPARISSSQTRKVYPQRGPYVNNPSRVPNDKPRTTNYPHGYRRVTTPAKDPQQKWNAVSGQRVVVRSATGKTKNTFSQRGRYVNNPSRKPRPTQRIISNESQLARAQGGPSAKPSGKGKRIVGASASRPYISNKSINAFAGFWSKKPKGEKPYTKGDLAGKPLRKKNFETRFPKIVNPTANLVKPKKPRDDRAYKGKAGGPVSATREQGKKAWTGDIAGRRVRGSKDPGIKKHTAGVPVFPPKRTKPKVGDTPYKGTIPGGGYRSATKKQEGQPGERLVGKAPGIGAKGVGTFQGTSKGIKVISRQGAGYAGNIKAKKIEKGGGSISAGGWNNEGRPLMGTPPLRRNIGMGLYQGNIKVAKKQPGNEIGGIAPRKFQRHTTMRDQGEEFTGTIKLSKKEPSKEVGGFPGKYKDKRPAFGDQGEEFTGFIKLPRFKRSYIQNENASDASLKKARPDKYAYKVNNLFVKVKQQEYKTKPHAAEGSLKGIVASKSSIKASEYTKVLRLNYDYISNPSSAKEAQKTREPGKAFARASDYQGNIKMKKFELFSKKELHPDAKFVKTNKNNVDEERGMLTNFKLFWAKLFGKEDTQPAHLKEKYRRPRYDKGEQGLWYNQHNTAPGKSNTLRNVKVEGN
jgi:hypothetical protein